MPARTDTPHTTQQRSPEQIRRDGNRLQNERSLYLQQHQHNPMDWYPWGHEALARATGEDKPIFLSIGYASCHWCHVMEHGVFEDDAVAAFMNEHFVNIKVDREERPDLDAVYMDAVQMITGGGGWPMSVFLTPGLKPFFGGTYFPRDQFLALGERVLDAYRTRRGEVEAQATSLSGAIAAGLEGRASGKVGTEALHHAVQLAKSTFDRTWGGFRARMKFPTPLRWRFLLRHARKTGDEQLAQMVRATLDHMSTGGIRDHLGGGFHRYTVDDAWIVPHFEKMLYDNAQLASLYLEAAAVFDSSAYREVARETLDFLLGEMVDVRGGVYASFDADSGGEEGSFYVWTPAEVRALASGRDGDVLAALLGVQEGGNFDGKSVLTRRVSVAEVANKFDLEPSEVERISSVWRPAMLELRAKREPPRLDRKIVTAWTSLAISAFVDGYRLLDDARYLHAATQAAAFLWTVHRSHDGTLYRVSNEGEPAEEAILDDYGTLACALLDLYEATGDVDHVRHAKQLTDFVLNEFAREEGGFYMTRKAQQAPLGRRFDPFDDVEPSGNSSLLHAAHRLAMMTGDPKYRTAVDKGLHAIGGLVGRTSLELAWWLDLAQLHQGPTYEVVIAGDPSDDGTQALKRAVHSRLPPHVTLIQAAADGLTARDSQLLAVARDMTAMGGRPTAYVCAFGACQRPTTEPAELARQLMGGWAA